MIAIIDYGAGNIQSVINALDDLNADFIVTNNAKEINESEKIIFPGVGEASSAMNNINSQNLTDIIQKCKKPFLGICLGMQLLCDYSEEGNVKCLGIIPVAAKKFNSEKVKVPHMGWNKIFINNKSKLFDEIENETYFYFANSFYVPANQFSIASCNYEINFSAAVQKENFYGVQFHPEKSGVVGIKLLKNFIEKC
ncbi:imidazole glycerol phosphate synthase subunit HisH [Melioribacteraceae bacterium 4301-Me]|uniref:imidazole glycerol phosphate synthase subunit HisH n=1 Tax=Pyranulibacter aquaticus TaxID=3163344 RepID=UPI00359B962E